MAAVAVAALITGCTHAAGSDATMITPSSPPPASAELMSGPVDTGALTPVAVDTADPDDVARTVVAALNQYDTRTDPSPAAAARRAAPLLDPDLADDIAGGGTRSDSTWLDLAQHDGYTTATTNLANEYGQPANTDLTAYSQVTVTNTPIGRDGWVGNASSFLVRVTLHRADAEASWLVSGFPT